MKIKCHQLKDLVDALLNDENGISHEAYIQLTTYLFTQKEMDLLEYVKRCDATDGRFYFPEEEYKS